MKLCSSGAYLIVVNSCHCFHVVYLETNVKCCWNFIKFNLTYLTCTHESSKKNIFSNGIGPHLFMKKWDFHAYGIMCLVSQYTKHGLKLDESTTHNWRLWEGGRWFFAICATTCEGNGWKIFLSMCRMCEWETIVIAWH